MQAEVEARLWLVHGALGARNSVLQNG
jgi:hypothetical protein